jgi:hypothetical protein
VVAVPVGANAYNSLWQVRNDAWSSLEESTAQLALAHVQQRSVERLTETVTATLNLLEPMERFWAFPGPHAYQKVRRLFADGHYDRCAAVVARLNRALATDSYGGGQVWDAHADEDAYDRDAHPAEQARTDRPYFEVLVVEDMSEEAEHGLRDELRRWRRPDDRFVYEIVVVPSFDDALMAARLNFRLQACVVRRRFAHRSRHDTSSLRQFVSLLGSDDLMEHSPDERAQVLARSLARIRPELDLYLMTEISVEDLAARLSRGRRRAAGPAADARSRPGAGPGLLHPVHPQDADLAAPGIDDPRLGPGLQPEGRGHLPRGLHDAHLHVPELPDPRLPGPGAPAGRAEGFELVQKQLENAMRLRDAVDHHPLLSKYMRCLTTADLIPAEHRCSGIDQPLRSGLPNMIKAWEADEFVLDPSRVTIYIGTTGIEGDAFKRSQLMDGYGVQINKTSRNTVLFMTTIGTTRSSVAYLIEVLVTIARELDQKIADMSPAERAVHERAVLRLTAPSAPLPDFSGFHPSFTDGRGLPSPEGDVRRAFYLAYNDSYCEYLTPDEVEQRTENGEQIVSTTYVTPYPPGFPVLVPGQVFSQQILSFMRSLDTPEVHGYRDDCGYRVYLGKALEIAATARPALAEDHQDPPGPVPSTSPPAAS